MLNYRFLLLFPLALFVFFVTRHSESQANSESGRAIFDGKTLNGWEGDPKYWRVENGAIVGEIRQGERLKANTWLIWRKGELRDFDLRLQVKLTGASSANSGIQFRCQAEDIQHVSGYQADLDQGNKWLGRIYDEHGRALLVERGMRVHVQPSGKRLEATFAPASHYAVFFRENDWNDYRIVGIGDHVAVFVNGVLFSELQDQQTGQHDLHGLLALQLHSGAATRVEFRNLRLETLQSDDTRLGDFEVNKIVSPVDNGVDPKDAAGALLNLGFEKGTLEGWTATGDAFRGQPVRADGISDRIPGQTSNKQGEFFIGGYEVLQDKGTGTLVSKRFRPTHPYASFWLGGGNDKSTRVEIAAFSPSRKAGRVFFSAVGEQSETMRRVMVDLRKYQDSLIEIRLIDNSIGAWGHINFDAFRFHSERFATNSGRVSPRSPLLQHLVLNKQVANLKQQGVETTNKMFVPEGFSVDVIAAEPDLHQPMAFTFDAQGRLWVVEGHCYPKKRRKGEGLDRILIFADKDGDGHFETRKVFAEGLNLVSGLEVGYSGVWVGAAPHLLFIPDADGDDRPDAKPTVLLDGFDYSDTHETLNSFLWGPDGWLYGNQGVFNRSLIGKPGTPQKDRQGLRAGVWRYHPTQHRFEIFAHGGSNQWGLDYNDFGQLFMTHCRSRYGKGLTTHVMQGGHYWNQSNRNYASFLSAERLSVNGRAIMPNYLLASARYGHGEGGAGKRGSRAVYGGHSHVGTMIYLGDNWPEKYRNHLFTHNLHGHQMNHQVNVREAGGYNTQHAGSDMLYCSDKQYIGVELKYGPDGAVYFSDWCDQRHCHNPNVANWDRGNGRLYRMKFDTTYKPVVVDYTKASDASLAQAQLHANDWHVRTARLVLSERVAQGKAISPAAVKQLQQIATEHRDPARRLRAFWALHGIQAVDSSLVEKMLADESEYVRGWAVQLSIEALKAADYAKPIARLAQREKSFFVRRYLASAIGRVPPDLGWEIAETLASQSENATERDLPLLLWHGIAGLVPADPQRAIKLADATTLAALQDYLLWYVVKTSSKGRNAMVQRIALAEPAEQMRWLTLFEHSIRRMRGLPKPEGWPELAAKLYAPSSSEQLRKLAESLGAAFGDDALMKRMRLVLAQDSASIEKKKHALASLANDTDPENLPLFLKLLDTKPLTLQILLMLSRYDDPSVASELIARLPRWNTQERSAAMEVLASRIAWSEKVLDTITEGKLEKGQLTAYHARQMKNLGNDSLNARLAKEWGVFGKTSQERLAEIEKLVKAYESAPLWAFNAEKGAAHFKRLCASCHRPNQKDKSIAPKLAGSGSKGIRYLAENVLDPNAVIGRDFQAWLIHTDQGRVLSGLIEKETESAITLRTASNSVTLARDEIEEMAVSENSFMPEGLLQTLTQDQKIELFKYLMSR